MVRTASARMRGLGSWESCGGQIEQTQQAQPLHVPQVCMFILVACSWLLLMELLHAPSRPRARPELPLLKTWPASLHTEPWCPSGTAP